MILFYSEHVAALLLVLVVAAATGTAVSGRRFPIAIRSALGLAAAGQLFILLGSLGILRPWSLASFAIVAVIAGTWRAERITNLRWRPIAVASLLFVPLFVLALAPPLAFDETLYHMPFVRALAESGHITFLAGLRFPVFPQLHELLSVPLFLLLGDQAAHLVSLAELIVLCGVMIEWAGPERRDAGLLAAALVFGSPIVARMATITYNEAALTLFVAAGFCCLDRGLPDTDRWSLAAAGLFFGSACSVKYLGGYFTAWGLVAVLLFSGGRRWRALAVFLGGLAAGMLPMYGRIVALSGNPLFPFLPRVFGTSGWSLDVTTNAPAREHLRRALRLCWDVTFSRQRLNNQPPFTPLFLGACAVLLASAFRRRRILFLAALFLGYLMTFTFLPLDSRYLLPLIPLVAIVAASLVGPWLRAKGAPVALLAILIAMPAPAYAVYLLVRQGWPPLSAAERIAFLEQRIPGYRALERRGAGRTFTFGLEPLKYYGGDDFVGDLFGPYDMERIVGESRNSAELADKLSRLEVRYLLMARLRWRGELLRLPQPPEFERVYSDDAAVLWRLR